MDKTEERSIEGRLDDLEKQNAEILRIMQNVETFVNTTREQIEPLLAKGEPMLEELQKSPLFKMLKGFGG